MSWKFEKEFRQARPETVGETDREFDLDNYKDFLEDMLSPKCTNCGKTMKVAAYECRSGMVRGAK